MSARRRRSDTLWALAAYPTQIFIKNNTIVYINPATNNTFVAIFYVIATCGSLLFSKINDMMIFGIANMAISLFVMAVKRYAFTSLWCAYAAVASVIILVYFWKSSAALQELNELHWRSYDVSGTRMPSCLIGSSTHYFMSETRVWRFT